MISKIGKKLKIMGVVLFWFLLIGGMTIALVWELEKETFRFERFFGITVGMLLLACLIRLTVCGFGIIVEAFEDRSDFLRQNGSTTPR